MVFVPKYDRWLWLIGEWSIDDLSYWWLCNPDEIISDTIDNTTIYVVLDLGIRYIPVTTTKTTEDSVLMNECEKIEILAAIAEAISDWDAEQSTDLIYLDGTDYVVNEHRPDWWPWPEWESDNFSKFLDWGWQEHVGLLIGLVTGSPFSGTNATPLGTRDEPGTLAYYEQMGYDQEQSLWIFFWRQYINNQ